MKNEKKNMNTGGSNSPSFKYQVTKIQELENYCLWQEISSS